MTRRLWVKDGATTTKYLRKPMRGKKQNVFEVKLNMDYVLFYLEEHKNLPTVYLCSV